MEAPNKPWPFDAPQNQLSYASRYVLEGELICHVYHGWEDGSWSFLPDRETKDGDCKLICLKHAYELDPSIAELADLPEGWKASRESREGGWKREKDHSYPEFTSHGYYLIPVGCWPEHYPELPDKKSRADVKPGQIVKLIFRFAHELSPPEDYVAERMWVEVTDVDEYGVYVGNLINEPMKQRPISCGHTLYFNQLHVLDISQRE